MAHFEYIDNNLCVNGHSLNDMAKAHGTPTYVYSAPRIIENYNALSTALNTALPDHDVLLCYATKANSHIAIVNLLAQQGSGADVVSGGELYRALKSGITPDKIVFSGVGKTEDEIKLAIEKKILQINVESLPELDRINEIAQDMNATANIGIRINPDVEAGEHDKTSTGRKDDKFGIDYDHGLAAYQHANSLSHLNITGVSVHIGSQIVDAQPFEDAYQKLAAFIKTLAQNGIDLANIDLGGGMGITYTRETPLDPNAYAAVVKKTVGQFNAKLIFEPGRALTGDAGVLLARVQYVKTTPSGKNFVILDTGMGDLMRPALYGSIHPVLPCIQHGDDVRPPSTYDVVGPICESSDIFDKNVTGPSLHPGDAVAITVSGAYGMSMASNYNTRPQPMEILVNHDHLTVISTRKNFDQLIEHETIPEWIA